MCRIISVMRDDFMNKIRILGLDPGFGRVGWALLDAVGQTLTVVGFGCWETKKGDDFAGRLMEIAEKLRAIIKKNKPDAAALEELFFFKNLKTVIPVAQARGAMMLVAKENNLPLVELTPLQVKQSICGYGRAEKIQVQKMVQLILKLKEIPRPDDAADALAVAIAAVPYFTSHILKCSRKMAR